MAYDYLQGLAESGAGLDLERLGLHLRVDTVGDGWEDGLITDVYLPAAWSACEQFCNRNVFPTRASMDDYAERFYNVDGLYGPDERPGTAPRSPTVIFPTFRSAVLLTLGHLYRNRESTTAERIVELPLGVHALLWPHRKSLGV